jgi:hypothetical protein
VGVVPHHSLKGAFKNNINFILRGFSMSENKKTATVVLHLDQKTNTELYSKLKQIKIESPAALKSVGKVRHCSESSDHGIANQVIIGKAFDSVFASPSDSDGIIEIIRGTTTIRGRAKDVLDYNLSQLDTIKKDYSHYLSSHQELASLLYVLVPNEIRVVGSYDMVYQQKIKRALSLRETELNALITYPYKIRTGKRIPDFKEYQGIRKILVNEDLALSGLFYELTENVSDGMFTPKDLDSAAAKVLESLGSDNAEITLFLQELCETFSGIVSDRKLFSKHAIVSISEFNSSLITTIKSINTQLKYLLEQNNSEEFHANRITQVSLKLKSGTSNTSSLLTTIQEKAAAIMRGEFNIDRNIVPGFFVRKKVNFLVSATGTGKSVITCNMMADLLTTGTMMGGRFILDESLSKSLKVLLIHTEKGAQTSMVDYIDRSGFIVDGKYLDGLYFMHTEIFTEALGESFDISKQAHAFELEKYIESVKPDIIILDTLTNIVSDKNCNKVAQGVMDTLRMIANNNDASLLAVYHKRKGSTKEDPAAYFSTDESAGASAYINQADSAFGIRQVRDDTGLVSKAAAMFLLKHGSLRGPDEWSDIRMDIKNVPVPGTEQNTYLGVTYTDVDGGGDSGLNNYYLELGITYDFSVNNPRQADCVKKTLNILQGVEMDAVEYNKIIRGRYKFSNSTVVDARTHMKTLGLITSRRVGKKTFYSLVDNTMKLEAFND